jgi:putative hydroxymethylpyrimidine transport system substrate-binding protein
VVRRIFFAGVVAAALLMPIAGCGGAGSTGTAEPVSEGPAVLRVTLDGFPAPQNIGILMAQHRGYFADAGILVEIHHPLAPVRPIIYVTNESAKISISHLPQVVQSREEGYPAVVAVGSLISQPTAAMIWLKKSKIGGIADLKGKTIATAGLSFEESFLSSILKQAGLTLADVKIENVNYEKVPALVSGRVDAIFGSPNLEGAELESRGLTPVVTSVQDLGVPPYEELVWIARRNFVSKYPQKIREFMSAVARGTAAAIEDPRAAAKLIVHAEGEARLRPTEAQLAATLPLLSRNGEMDPQQASHLVEWMHEEGLIRQEPPVSAFLSDNYLTGN